MGRRASSILIFVPLVILAIWGVIAGNTASPENWRITDVAAVLIVVPAIAIAIERLIEVFWTIIGLFFGSAWPLNRVGNELKRLQDDLNTTLTPIYQAATDAATQLENLHKLTDLERKAAHAQIAKLQKITTDLATVAPDRTQLQMFAQTAVQHINHLELRYGTFLRYASNEKWEQDIVAARKVAEEAARRERKTEDEIRAAGDEAASVAEAAFDAGLAEPAAQIGRVVAWGGQVVEGMTDFLASFKDNPARRLLSLYLGAFVGVTAAWLLSLDVFHAVLVQDSGNGTAQVAVQATPLGIVLTGLLIGLGANPTHEVIKVLQEYKKLQRARNTPELSGGAGSSRADSGVIDTMVMFEPPRRTHRVTLATDQPQEFHPLRLR